jgi:acyl-CoA reductase-like NAD-dependent aldehyde dehydrogenase
MFHLTSDAITQIFVFLIAQVASAIWMTAKMQTRIALLEKLADRIDIRSEATALLVASINGARQHNSRKED